jgi:dihydrodipicolinate synthase/N-acetylneuraminate lyase
VRHGDWTEAERIRTIFAPLETLRNAHSPIRVLHEAVAAAGIAATGPILPLLDPIEPAHAPAIGAAARALLAADAQVGATR